MPWTTADMPPLHGRRAVITGANSGLGLAVARALAEHGAAVVLACRNLDKGRAALTELETAVPGAELELAGLDLADLASIADFADRYEREHPDGLDLLINNAGIMAPPAGLTADGFESQLGTNHLGHFALTGRLLGALLARQAPRIVTVSSAAHRMGRPDFDDVSEASGRRRWRAYGRSKLANLSFALELDRRARAAGTPLVSVAAHPGYAATNLQTSSPRRHEALAMRLLNTLVAQSAEMGALPLLFAATMEDLPGGTYIGPDGGSEMRGHPRPVSPSPIAEDPAVARRLWERSESLTGVSFPALAPA